jgi:hypothetical protein
MSLCILVPTYDRYLPLASFTVEMIGRYWEGHPPVFFCGCRKQASRQSLPLRDDPRDWIGILRSAADDLVKAGHDKAYVIIDDCPPLAPCNGRHLNATLPRLMDRLSACNISLTGWDQRGGKGSILGKEFYRVQRHPESFLWRFSAGPSLWNLAALRDLLDVLVPTDDPMSRSAWAFERRLGGGKVTIPQKWRDGSYRICGRELLGGLGRVRDLARRLRRRVHAVVRLCARAVAGTKRGEGCDRSMSVESAFYDGPYPSYWSGIMAAGALNEDLVTFLKRRGDVEYLGRLRSAVSQIPP